MTDPEIQRADAARVPYLEPHDLGSHEGRTRRMPPRTSLVESYLTQQHAWRGEGGTVVTRATRTGAPPSRAEIDAAPPDDHWLLTAWNPVGNRRTLRDNEAATARLRADVDEAGGQVVGVVATTPPDRSWVEDTLVIVGLAQGAVAELARDYWQPAFTGLSPTTLRIVPSGLVDGLREATALREDVVSPPTCPMRVDDEPGALCTMRGGPWVSASIHAAALWQAHRALLLSRLGCVPCGDGVLPVLGPLARTGGPIAVGEDRLVLASRYGGYVWQ